MFAAEYVRSMVDYSGFEDHPACYRLKYDYVGPSALDLTLAVRSGAGPFLGG